ncbi:MAG: hypothetical protein WAM76_08975 [Pseudolabrys sp.]
MHLVDAIAAHQDLDRPLAVVTHKAANPSGRLGSWHRLIVECQKVVARLDSGSGSRRGIGNR